MKGFLVDTNVALAGALGPEGLSPQIRAALVSGPNWLSVICYWEVIIKCGKGRLPIANPHQWWANALAHLGGRTLAVQEKHIAAVYDLPRLHHDPFDRALVAQAIVEDLTLVTMDRTLVRYAS
ncbi:MAG TPA: type II toxin-antitoxin system VapC family toxin, partial [Terriglobales bacterium]